ncbi:MAG: PLD nuclease N-terminal domain-containing protein [Gemmatimonadota bacterium]
MTEILRFAASIDQRIVLLLLLIALDGWSIGEVWLSPSTRRDKWLWTGIIIVCPIIGCLFWFVLGPKAPRQKTPF